VASINLRENSVTHSQSLAHKSLLNILLGAFRRIQSQALMESRSTSRHGDRGHYERATVEEISSSTKFVPTRMTNLMKYYKDKPIMTVECILCTWRSEP